MNKFQRKKKENNNKKRKRIVIDKKLTIFQTTQNKICLLINSELLSKFSIADQKLFSIQKKYIHKNKITIDHEYASNRFIFGLIIIFS